MIIRVILIDPSHDHHCNMALTVGVVTVCIGVKMPGMMIIGPMIAWIVIPYAGRDTA